MIGLCIDGIPSLGTIFNATENKYYYASINNGAFMKDENGKVIRLHCNDEVDLENAIASVSSKNKENVKEMLKKLNITKTLKKGSMGLKCCDIANGLTHIYFNLDRKSSCWDTCAANVILKEAGALPISNLKTLEPIQYIGNSTLHNYDMVVSTKKLSKYLKK